MTPTPPTNGAAELRETIQSHIEGAYHRGHFDARWKAAEDESKKEFAVDEILAAFAAHLRTIESKLPEDDIDAELSARYDLIIPEETAGFRIAANIAHTLLTAEIEGLEKQ